MAHSLSAKKRVRQNDKRRARNRQHVLEVTTAIRVVDRLRRRPDAQLVGILRRDALQQLAYMRVANVLNQPIYPNAEPEASLRGAAVFVLEKLGHELAPAKFSRPILPQKKAARV